MMSEPRPDGKITLEDVLRIKRAERPPADFWTAFERELRTRQLAAAVEKRRWWFALPRVWGRLARYQMPMGAAAVLAVTFLTLREYREPGMEPHYAPAVAAAPVAESAAEYDEVVQLAVVDVVPQSTAPATRPNIERPISLREPLSPMVPWSGAVGAEVAEAELSPSERSIAANLAVAESEWAMDASTGLALGSAQQREPLAQLSSPRDQRRERLFAYDPQLASYDTGPGDAAPERVASRLGESELYESVRRLSGGGDRLTLRF